MEWYFVIRFLGSTGSRINELLQFKVEHVLSGSIDLYAKGGKIRRIYIPEALQKDAMVWMKERGMTSGYIFINRVGRNMPIERAEGGPTTIVLDKQFHLQAVAFCLRQQGVPHIGLYQHLIVITEDMALALAAYTSHTLLFAINKEVERSYIAWNCHAYIVGQNRRKRVSHIVL